MLHTRGKEHTESIGIEVSITILFKDKNVKNSFK